MNTDNSLCIFCQQRRENYPSYRRCTLCGIMCRESCGCPFAVIYVSGGSCSTLCGYQCGE